MKFNLKTLSIRYTLYADPPLLLKSPDRHFLKAPVRPLNPLNETGKLDDPNYFSSIGCKKKLNAKFWLSKLMILERH